MLSKQQSILKSVLVFYCWLWASKCQLGYSLMPIKSSLYIQFVIKRKPLINLVWSLCIYEAIIRISSLKYLKNTLKIVKNEYIYEVASFNFTRLIGSPSQFFSKYLAEVKVTAYNSSKFITHCDGCFCIFADFINRFMQSFVTSEV